MFQVKLTYKDDKAYTLPLEEEKLGEFYGALSQRQLFWIEPGKNGFWTDFNDIRFVNVFKEEEDGTISEVSSDKIEAIQDAQEATEEGKTE